MTTGMLIKKHLIGAGRGLLTAYHHIGEHSGVQADVVLVLRALHLD